MEPSESDSHPSLTSETSSEQQAQSQPDPQLDECISNFHLKAKDYFEADMVVTLEEYGLLKTMNEATTQKYADVKMKAEGLSDDLEALLASQESMRGYFGQISLLEEKVNRLESDAYKLDGYLKRLETKMKELDRPQPTK